MKVRQCDVSQADKASAKVFFQHLFSFYDLADTKVLDAFARNGQLTVSSYFDRICPNNLECWELGQEHWQSLLQYTYNVKIGCSYAQQFKASAEQRQWGMVVIDTPQGLHTDTAGQVYAEHWSFMERLFAFNLLNSPAVLALYVNKNPYDKNKQGSHGYDEYQEYNYEQWMQMRRRFYGCERGPEEQFIARYRMMASECGWQVKSMVTTPCFSDVPGLEPYAFRLGLEVAKR